MAATHGGILYYVVQVPKQTRWVDRVLCVLVAAFGARIPPEFDKRIRKESPLRAANRRQFVSTQ
jgi:hypothetical protein